MLRAADEVLETGDLESPGDALLLKGMAHYHLAEHGAALAAFERAEALEATRERARRWAAYVGYELADLRAAAPSSP